MQASLEKPFCLLAEEIGVCLFAVGRWFRPILRWLSFESVQASDKNAVTLLFPRLLISSRTAMITFKLCIAIVVVHTAFINAIDRPRRILWNNRSFVTSAPVLATPISVASGKSAAFKAVLVGPA